MWKLKKKKISTHKRYRLNHLSTGQPSRNQGLLTFTDLGLQMKKRNYKTIYADMNKKV